MRNSLITIAYIAASALFILSRGGSAWLETARMTFDRYTCEDYGEHNS